MKHNLQNIGIYIHIPFCKRGCFYCHFVKQKFDSEAVEKYITALTREISLKSNSNYIIDTIYIGGGSPSLLNEKQTAAIIDSIQQNFTLSDSIEFTFEMNPEDITVNQLKSLKSLGINRLSIGTQSFCPTDIEYLKRPHSVQDSIDSISRAIETGFTNFNIDFIISLPTQTKTSLEENFSILNRFPIPHISAYLLEEVEDGEIKDERDNELYFFAEAILSGFGYDHYEVSNFSKPGYSSRHNMKYWKNEPYIGAGLSASGFEDGIDYKNTVKMKTYIERIDQGLLPIKEEHRPDMNLRRIIMGLRIFEGIPEVYFAPYRKSMEFLIENGFLIRKERRISVSPGKMLLLNEILTYF